MKLKNLFVFCLVFFPFVARAEMWLFCQEFVRFGKKNVYEELKKTWNEQYAEYFKKNQLDMPVLAIQDLNSAEYIYLTPILTYSRLDQYTKESRLLEDAVKNELKVGLSSVLNFNIQSLQCYLGECSYIPEFINPSFCNMPYAHYQIFSVFPGKEVLVEDHLKKMVFDEQMKKSNQCWRVWKTTFGGDLPKYIVCRFASTEENLEKEEIFFIPPYLKEVIRSHREGKGILRRDLSVIISCNIQTEE